MVKLGTVSPDLLIKLALVAGAIGLAWYAYKQASGAAGQTPRDLKDSAQLQHGRLLVVLVAFGDATFIAAR